MAILPLFPGLVVDILVDGAPLQERIDEDEQVAHDKATRYIEAQSDAHFAIRVQVNNPLSMPQFSKRVQLDGVQVRSTVYSSCPSKELYLDPGRMFQIGNQTVCQRYRFNEMTVIVGNTNLISKDLLEKLAATGTIRVTFQGACNTRESTCESMPLTLSGVDFVPEKALKDQAKSHSASLSEPTEAASPGWSEWDDVGIEPFATFEFKYRSRAALQALHLVPGIPTPAPLEDRPEDELNPEELRELVKILKEREAAAVKAKKESAAKRKRAVSTDEDSDATVDFEIVGEKRKRRNKVNSDEVIAID